MPTLFRILIIVILFIFILFLAYFASKMVGRYSYAKGKNIKIIEFASLGSGNTLALIEVAGEYFLLGVTKQEVNLITKLDRDNIIDPQAPDTSFLDFKSYFNNMKKKEDINNNEK